MNDRSLKADAETARLVTDLAYLLSATKKQVLAEAVAAYAAPRMPAGRERRPFTDLPVPQRLVLRRDELRRVFERHGASEIRIMEPPADDDDVELVELLAETDVMMGGGAADLLAGLARDILKTRVAVISATALAFSDPELLKRLRAASTPL